MMSTVVSSSQPVLPYPGRGASWLRSPQRKWLRRAVFQVHLWLGVALTLYAVVIGLSGAALVFRPEMERALRPQLFDVRPATQQVTLTDTIAAVEVERPGWRVASVRDFDKPAEATTLLLRPAQGVLDANCRMVSVNPYTGAVLADRMRFGGVLGWLSNLHFYLLAGKTGLLVSGWMAGGLLLLCLTGLVVWWPGVSRWRGAVMLRPGGAVAAVELGSALGDGVLVFGVAAVAEFYGAVFCVSRARGTGGGGRGRGWSGRGDAAGATSPACRAHADGRRGSRGGAAFVAGRGAAGLFDPALPSGCAVFRDGLLRGECTVLAAGERDAGCGEREGAAPQRHAAAGTRAAVGCRCFLRCTLDLLGDRLGGPLGVVASLVWW